MYVEDLIAHLNTKCHQYADDTTLYKHCKPKYLQNTVTSSTSNSSLSAWRIGNWCQLGIELHQNDTVSVDMKVKGNSLEHVGITQLQYLAVTLGYEVCVCVCGGGGGGSVQTPPLRPDIAHWPN